jgi:murein DD-endopeptidase MepM/ murein hydrolase activator NlpD
MRAKVSLKRVASMSPFESGFCSRLALRLAATSLAAGLLAGCSNSERLSEAFSNPFAQSGQNLAAARMPEQTASRALESAAPVSPVQSQPLSPPVASAPLAPKPVFAAERAAPARAYSYAGWSGEGGSPITVAQGETAETLARRYGVPLDALLRTNGLAAASEVRPGTNLIIPVYHSTLAASSTSSAAQNRTAAPAKPSAGQLAQATPVERPAPKSAAPRNEPKLASLPKADLPKAEPARPVLVKETVKPVAAKAEVIASEAKKAPPAKQEALKVAKAEAPVIAAKKPTESNSTASAPAEAGKPASDESTPEFRWPARGRIIQGFKPGGNDGINIALPEGTSVKAVESGVVAYAGNELKGYGNLVLIRHPNGFVSAYANNGDLEVKRGDTVKRGQVIAKSGQTGNVSSPQLHFELRKGAKPVDPTQYLAGL